MERRIVVRIGEMPQCFGEVICSDEIEVLRLAGQMHQAVIGVEAGETALPAGLAPYVVPGWEYVDEELAELVFRRHRNLPWIIGRTKRLVIRELTADDARAIPGEELTKEEQIFCLKEGIEAYIRGQYRLREYGIWALQERESGALVGLAGVSPIDLPEAFAPKQNVLELGYRIFLPYRRQGFAREACEEILAYAHEVLDTRLVAVIEEKNDASRRFAEGMGFSLIETFTQTNTRSGQRRLLYAENCP